MLSLTRFAKTLSTTKNFVTVLMSRQNGKRVTVKFRNGFQLNLLWSQFVYFRDNYKTMSDFSINQLNDDLLKITGESLDYVGSASDIGLILKVKEKCQIQQVGKETFRLLNKEFEIVGSYVSSGLFFLVNEFLKGDYAVSCHDKVVLDVGGFEGETAVFFSLMGAKKVVIYEPVAEHHEFIRKNISRNKVTAEIHEEGIGEKNEIKTIHYDITTVGFGFNNIGTKEMNVKVRSATEVIETSGAEIAKFDCEGGELSLVNVPRSTLRKIRFYMIETHSSTIKKALIDKFSDSGFLLTRDSKGDPCCLVHFERREDL